MKVRVDKTRRNLLANMGMAAIYTPFIGLIGCDDSSTETTESETTQDETTEDTTTEQGTSDTEASTETSIEWAAGGTDLITLDYPDDTLFESAGICSLLLTERTTEGPCYLGVNNQEDISDGETGLPMMLCLQVIDQNCNPLEGYLVEVWHCNREGIYSGDESQSDDTSTFAGSFCTANDQEAENSTWFRGELTTDSNGRVNFKTCFPGWYGGRTIHIHFRVRLEYGGADYIVSQFCFDDDFCEDICTTHSLYSDRGVQDTPLSDGSDTVFPSSGYDNYLLNTAQNDDGTLLGYKRIMIEI
ncbi:MAG: intradiol ring-cleavage dioxygenase [gamma proteobacterium symbiont of Ctena orbiculata]|nr:MAG: intradiol ring-cleavage dioxygenase [gamma proteobacterium symbiont of Ctena orbiculata]PVV24809.1 MAG: intradiol ring-cleavage dioxygenase [gamma proteobacterium symbiont of Ctena orbiculata]